MKFKNQENRTYVVDVDENDKVLSVKTKLSESVFAKVDDIVLIYKNKRLDNDRLIKEYNICPNEIVLICLRLDYLANEITNLCKCKRKNANIIINLIAELMRNNILRILRRTSIRSSKRYSFKQKAIGNADISDYNYLGTHSVEDFIILNQIGSGAFGSVDKCIDSKTKKYMVLKNFHIPKFARETEKSYENLTRQFKIICSIGNHPHIVKMSQMIETKWSVYIVMEYAPMGSLKELCEKEGALDERRISRYSCHILKGLEFLHKKEILHGDIKASNILLFENDIAKLSDFGLSNILTEFASLDLLNGATKSFIGLHIYTPPEVILDEEVGLFSDIWSFGATVIEMMTGKPPFHNVDSEFAILSKIAVDKKIPYAEPKQMSCQFKSFLESCLQPNPSSRLSASNLLNHEFINYSIFNRIKLCLPS